MATARRLSVWLHVNGLELALKQEAKTIFFFQKAVRRGLARVLRIRQRGSPCAIIKGFLVVIKKDSFHKVKVIFPRVLCSVLSVQEVVEDTKEATYRNMTTTAAAQRKSSEWSLSSGPVALTPDSSSGRVSCHGSPSRIAH